MQKVILVVEDEPNILDPLEFLLERNGLTVDSVVDGRITSYNVCYTKLLRERSEQPFELLDG